MRQTCLNWKLRESCLEWDVLTFGHSLREIMSVSTTETTRPLVSSDHFVVYVGRVWTVVSVRERRQLQNIKLTRSTTSVASGVLLVLGGISLSWGLVYWDCDGMFLMNLKLEKKLMLLEKKSNSCRGHETGKRWYGLQKLTQRVKSKKTKYHAILLCLCCLAKIWKCR